MCRESSVAWKKMIVGFGGGGQGYPVMRTREFKHDLTNYPSPHEPTNLHDAVARTTIDTRSPDACVVTVIDTEMPVVLHDDFAAIGSEFPLSCGSPKRGVIAIIQHKVSVGLKVIPSKFVREHGSVSSLLLTEGQNNKTRRRTSRHQGNLLST